MRVGIRCVPVAALGFGLVLAGLATSGGVADATSASSVFGPSYKAMLSAKTAQITLGISGDDAVTATGPCVFKISYCSYTLNLTLPSPTGGATTQASAAEVLDGNKLYIKLPASLGGSAAKPWSESSTLGSTGASSSQDEDPSQALLDLDKYATNVSKVGSATIGGVSTTEYSATFNPASIKSTTSTTLVDIGPIPVNVWLDSHHRVVQMQETIPATSDSSSSAVPTSTAPQPTVVTIGFAHFGEHVTVTIPPASQVSSSGGI